MRYKPERALTPFFPRINYTCFCTVEMRYKPERALTHFTLYHRHRWFCIHVEMIITGCQTPGTNEYLT